MLSLLLASRMNAIHFGQGSDSVRLELNTIVLRKRRFFHDVGDY